MTDLNALIERLDEAIAAIEADMIADAEDAQTTGERPDLWDYEVSLRPSDAQGILAALRTLAERQPVGDDPDEAYEIGLDDGYAKAVQELDQATGGDGVFYGSTFPGETVDVPVMKQRIIERLTADQAAEQRAADRAFEKAAVIAQEFFGIGEAARNGIPVGTAIARAIRQRIGTL